MRYLINRHVGQRVGKETRVRNMFASSQDFRWYLKQWKPSMWNQVSVYGILRYHMTLKGHTEVEEARRKFTLAEPLCSSCPLPCHVWLHLPTLLLCNSPGQRQNLLNYTYSGENKMLLIQLSLKPCDEIILI